MSPDKRQPAETIILETIDGFVRIIRHLPLHAPVLAIPDRRPFTGWERARRTQLPRATPAAGD